MKLNSTPDLASRKFLGRVLPNQIRRSLGNLFGLNRLAFKIAPK